MPQRSQAVQYLSIQSNTVDEFENIEISQNMIPKNYYEEILDGYFPEANLDDKELTACRRIARKHLERGDKLNDKLENAYKKLPFKNDTDQVHKIIDKLSIYSDDNVIIYDELTEEQKESFYNEYNQYFQSRQNVDKILKILIRIKDLETEIRHCHKLFEKVYERYDSNNRTYDNNRFKYITRSEEKAYTNILRIINHNNFPGVNILRKLKDGYWELLTDEQKFCLIECIENIQDSPNWEDVVFKIDDIEKKFMHPFEYRNVNVIREIAGVFDNIENYDEYDQEEIDNIVKRADRVLHKMYCKLFKFKYDESRFDLNVQIDNFLNNKLLEDKRKLNELRAKDVSKPPLANIKHKNSKFLSK